MRGGWCGEWATGHRNERSTKPDTHTPMPIVTRGATPRVALGAPRGATPRGANGGSSSQLVAEMLLRRRKRAVQKPGIMNGTRKFRRVIFRHARVNTGTWDMVMFSITFEFPKSGNQVRKVRRNAPWLFDVAGLIFVLQPKRATMKGNLLH